MEALFENHYQEQLFHSQIFVAPYAYVKPSVGKGKFYAFGLPVVIKLHKKSAFVHADLVLPGFFELKSLVVKLDIKYKNEYYNYF